MLTKRCRLGDELGVDPNVILATSHGRRTIDVLKVYDENKANWDCKNDKLLAICRLTNHRYQPH